MTTYDIVKLGKINKSKSTTGRLVYDLIINNVIHRAFLVSIGGITYSLAIPLHLDNNI